MLHTTQKARFFRARLNTVTKSLLMVVLSIIIPMMTAAPSQAIGNFNNDVIASYAVNNYAPGSYGGQCRTFVNNVVAAATGLNVGTGWPDYFAGFENAGAQRITNVADLRKGDIVQYGQFERDVHTFIIVGHVSGNTFDVIDSNSGHNGYERVSRYNRAVILDNSKRAYRLGIVASAPNRSPRFDFNGDGRSDFFSLNNGGSGVEYVVATSSSSGFNGPGQWANLQGWGWHGMKPFVGDFNGDGKSDVGSLNDQGNSVSLPVSVSNGSNLSTTTNWLNLPWGWGAMKVLAGDFNGDGKDDFFSLNNGGTGIEYVVATSTGSGFNLPGQWTNLQGWGWHGMKPFVGDFNGDGKDDIGSVNDQGGSVSVVVSLSNGSNFNSPQTWLALSWSWSSLKILSGDFNGDGKDDFFSLNNGGTGIEYVVAFADGSGGGFNSPAQWANLQGWSWSGMKPFVGDFNGDGKDDIGSVNDQGNSVSLPVSISNGVNAFAGPSNWLNLPWGWGAMNIPNTGVN